MLLAYRALIKLCFIYFIVIDIKDISHKEIRREILNKNIKERAFFISN